MIKIEKLAIGYDKKTILDNLTLQVNKGDYISIIGNNGVGKSTLIKVLLGLLKPIKGTITKEYNQNQIGYLPQLNTNKKDFPATVEEIIKSGLQLTLPFMPKFQKEQIKNIMQTFQINHLKKHSFQELSGGQMQKVLLARTLICPKEIIILDEPTAGLDKESTKEFYQLLKNLNKKKLTIIIVTHDYKYLSDSSHILELKNKPFYGSTKDYLKEVKS